MCPRRGTQPGAEDANIWTRDMLKQVGLMVFVQWPVGVAIYVLPPFLAVPLVFHERWR